MKRICLSPSRAKATNSARSSRSPTYFRCSESVPLAGGGLGFSWVDFDAALEVSAILDADARGGDIADDGAVGLDVDALAGVDIPDDFAVDDDLPGVNFRIELGLGADGEFVAVERDGAIHFAVNLQIFGTGDVTLDCEAGPQSRGVACSGAAESSGRSRAKRNRR